MGIISDGQLVSVNTVKQLFDHIRKMRGDLESSENNEENSEQKSIYFSSLTTGHYWSVYRSPSIWAVTPPIVMPPIVMPPPLLNCLNSIPLINSN